MRVISLNVNGIRAAEKKGFFKWLSRQRADFVCLQELKAQPDQICSKVFHPDYLHCFYHSAQKKGYSGVAIFSRQKPDAVKVGIGWNKIDLEGRYIEVQLGNLSVVSLYIPSGTSGSERQDFKMQFLKSFLTHLQHLAKSGRNYIICGDWNIAHRAIDLRNWRSNQKNSDFLPEERAWMDKLFNCAGYADAFRVINQQPGEYTWWSNRGDSWKKNVGWRLDYQVISSGLRSHVVAERIYTRTRFSDHAPLIIDYSEEIRGC